MTTPDAVTTVGDPRARAGWARRWRARSPAPGFAVVLYNRTPEPAHGLAAELGARVAADARRGSPPPPTSRSRCSPTTRRSRRSTAGPTGSSPGVRPDPSLVDMSTVLPGTIRALEPAVRARGAGILDAPVSGSIALAEAGELTLMVGGEAADLERARPVLEALGARDLPPRPARHRRGDEARRQHGHLRPQRGPRRGARPRRAGRRRPRHRLRRLAASAVGAPFVGYKRAAFVDPESTPSRSRSTSPRRTSADHRAGRRGRRRCPRRRRTSSSSGRPAPQTPAARLRLGRGQLRAAGPVATGRATDAARSQRITSARPTRRQRRNRAGGDTPWPTGSSSSGGIVLTQDPTLGELPPADVLIEGDTIAAVGPEPAAPTAPR